MPGQRNTPADVKQFDLSPWVSASGSSRVSRFRYDHANSAVQVQWTNQKNHGYIYNNLDYEAYRLFARAVSKGRKINTYLNGYPYRMMTDTEVSAPSNSSRKGLASRTQSST